MWRHSAHWANRRHCYRPAYTMLDICRWSIFPLGTPACCCWAGKSSRPDSSCMIRTTSWNIAQRRTRCRFPPCSGCSSPRGKICTKSARYQAGTFPDSTRTSCCHRGSGEQAGILGTAAAPRPPCTAPPDKPRRSACRLYWRHTCQPDSLRTTTRQLRTFGRQGRRPGQYHPCI